MKMTKSELKTELKKAKFCFRREKKNLIKYRGDEEKETHQFRKWKCGARCVFLTPLRVRAGSKWNERC